MCRLYERVAVPVAAAAAETLTKEHVLTEGEFLAMMGYHTPPCEMKYGTWGLMGVVVEAVCGKPSVAKIVATCSCGHSEVMSLCQSCLDFIKNHVAHCQACNKTGEFSWEFI